MNSSTILTVDADRNVRTILCDRLSDVGHEVIEASNGSAALSKLRKQAADLVVLDEALPDLCGLDVLCEIKRNEEIGPTRVLMTSNGTDGQFVVKALGNGADDHLSKPYSILEIIARIELGLKRAPVSYSDKKVLTVGDICIDEVSHAVSGQGKAIELSPLEYRLLYFFVTNQDRMFSREQLLRGVWKNQEAVNLRTVDVNVRRLRVQLSPSGCDRYIQTVRANGYRFSV